MGPERIIMWVVVAVVIIGAFWFLAQLLDKV